MWVSGRPSASTSTSPNWYEVSDSRSTSRPRSPTASRQIVQQRGGELGRIVLGATGGVALDAHRQRAHLAENGSFLVDERRLEVGRADVDRENESHGVVPGGCKGGVAGILTHGSAARRPEHAGGGRGHAAPGDGSHVPREGSQ